MWKVLNNVEAYSRTGLDLDGALGVGIVLGSYPGAYPATGFGACSALATEAYASIVKQYYQPPAGWKDWCNRQFLRW